MSRVEDTTRRRLAPEERRAQLLDVASEILATEGADQLRVPHLAARAGVTRPVVYRFFQNRQAIVLALVEDFADELEARFKLPLASHADSLGLGGSNPIAPAESLDAMVEHFVNVACDAIEARGPGAWLLLSGVAFDDATRDAVEQLSRRLSTPWMRRVAHVTQAEGPQVRAISDVLVASSRAVLRLWIMRKLEREAVVDTLTRVVRAVLGEFRP